MNQDSIPQSKPSPKARTCQLLVGYTVGGVERQLIRVLPYVARSGYEMSVCALKGPGPLIQEFQALGFQTSWLAGKGKWDPKVVFKLYLFLRRKRPTILHCYTTLANWAGTVAGKAAGIPLIIMSDRDIRTWLRPWQAMIEKGAFRLGTCMTMPSEAIKRFNIERFGHSARKLVVVPNGVNVEGVALVARCQVDLNRESNKQRRARIGYVGRIVEPLKGLRVILKALLLLDDHGFQYEALMVGDGKDRKKMERFSHKLGLDGKVVFVGERNDVPCLMNSLDLLVVPSFSEGSPNVALEAMALGVPVVATEVGGTPEIIRNGVTGWLVPPGDPVALAKIMADVLEDRSKALEVACQARAWVARHRSLEVAGTALVKLYDYLLEETQITRLPFSQLYLQQRRQHCS